MSAAPPPPAPPATPGFPNLPGGRWPARPASSPATATCPRRPISPPARAAAPRRPSRPASRTAALGRTCPVSPPRDVTPAAAPITAAPAGPLAGIGPPGPAHLGWPGSRSPSGEEPEYRMELQAGALVLRED